MSDTGISYDERAVRLSEAAEIVFNACREVSEELSANFDAVEITLYWHNLRLDVPPEDFSKAIKLIKDAKALGARFE